MIWFLVKRLGWMVLTLWVVFTTSFFLMRAVPGGPFDSGKKLPAAIKRNIEKRYQMDRPLIEQYWSHLWATMRCDFGPSYKLEDYAVNDVIAQGFPVSASLGILAMTFALSLGLVSGVVSAVLRNSVYDVSFMVAATIGIAVPNFVLASLMIVLFVFFWPVFPAAGWGELRQIILPALCLGAPLRLTTDAQCRTCAAI